MFAVSSRVCLLSFLVSLSTSYLSPWSVGRSFSIFIQCFHLDRLAPVLQQLGLVISSRSANAIAEISVHTHLFRWLKSVLLRYSFCIWKLHSLPLLKCWADIGQCAGQKIFSIFFTFYFLLFFINFYVFHAVRV